MPESTVSVTTPPAHALCIYAFPPAPAPTCTLGVIVRELLSIARRKHRSVAGELMKIVGAQLGTPKIFTVLKN
jgi:hypothetical protein